MQQLKPIVLFAGIMLAGINIKAQKKLVPVSQSSLTGIALPAGSRQDSRFLIELSGKALLEMETKKANTTVTKTEIFYLPATTAGANPDSIVQQLTALGWSIIPVQGDDKFVWLQKDNRYIITYFSLNKKDNDLYFGEVANAPAVNGNNSGYQNPNGQQNTQQPDPQQNGQQQNGQQQPDPQQAGQNTNQVNDQQQATQNIITATAKQDGFAFTTTNFDDGWTSVVQEDWVEVTKGNIKVLLHYPKEGTIFPADPDPLTTAAWNILVSPRYSNLKNYKTAYISTYNRPYLGMGYATETSTGREVFVLLFRQGEGWIEFITPDKNSFIQQYKFDPETIRWDSESDLMKPLASMTGYNKFAVGAADFKEKWTSDFTGIQQLYNVYTGNYAGMYMNQSNEEFIFSNDGTYNWKLLVVNGMAGNAKFTEVKSSGQLTVVNNWQVHCSKIESGPKTFNAFWSCIKGARILNLLDAQSPGSGIYTKYGLAK
jgi:hypothetical protein